MKFIKKAAALFFCLALALSVMAITAAADGTPVFTLSLAQSTSFADKDGVTNGGIEVGTSNGKNAVTYTMTLTCDEGTPAVSAFSFKVANVTGMTTAVTFYEGGNSTTSQAAETKTYTSGDVSGTIYSFSSTATTSKDFPVTTSGVAIGAITFTFDTTANNTTVTPSLTEINLQTRDTSFNKDKFDVLDVSTPTAIQVNPVYTMTLKDYGVNETTGIKNTNSTDTTMWYDYEGTIYSAYTNATINTVGALASSTKPTAYDYSNGFTSGWKVTTVNGTSGSCGWTANVAQAAVNTFSDNRVGDVTLEAQYTAITYHYTYVYGNGTPDGGATYTVEDITDFVTNPTWMGYDFKGWSATQDNTYNHDEYSSVWTSYATAPNYTEDVNTGLMSAAPTQKAYGDVTLKAVWDEAGKFVTTTYAYAGSANVLVLYAVQTSNSATDKDTYKYTLAENDVRDMFKVPATKATKYISEFGFNDTELAAFGEYVMYAYIAPTGAAKGNVTVTKGGENDTSGNVELAYTGNVYRGASGNDTAINTADYGNVDALLAANGGTASATTFTQSDVRARLESDVVNAGDTVGTTTVAANSEGATVQTAEVYYGSIWDIKAIFAKLT